MADKPFKILQLNTQKKQGVMHSLMNDEKLETFGAFYHWQQQTCAASSQSSF